MKYITKEKIILGLFSLGFDKVDNLLYTYTLSEVLKNNEFKLLNKDFSIYFKQNISYLHHCLFLRRFSVFRNASIL